MRPWSLVLLLSLATLAGCSDGGKSADPGDAAVIVPPPAAAGKGVIVGIVVDEAIAPVVAATVSLADGQETTTDANGAFGFGNLDPGPYFVRVEKPGYVPAQQSVEVQADVEEPPVLKVLLQRDLENAPYFLELVFKGFIECSSTYLAICAVPNDVVENATNDRFIQTWPIDAPDPMLVQSEMVWDSTQAVSDRLWLWHSHADSGGVFAGSFEHVTGPSPLLLQTLPEEVEAADGLDAAWQLVIRVFSGDVEGTTPPMCVVYCNGPGIAVNQEFEVFTHVFYNYAPPEAWRFTEAGAPPPAG